MDRQTVLVAGSVFLLFALVGFYVGFMQQGNPERDDGFVEGMNITASSDQNIATARFDNRSLNLMHEDGEEASFYLDLDRDGSFDFELKDLNRTGEVEKTSRVVSLEDKDYRLYFRYRDSPAERGDSWLSLYLVREV